MNRKNEIFLNNKFSTSNHITVLIKIKYFGFYLL
jgi:hypothetical protein